MNNLLKKGNFLGTKAGTLILIHNDEWVGEQEEEHVAIVAMIRVESEKTCLSVIHHNDRDFNSAQEKGTVFKCSKWGNLRKYYKQMKTILKSNPNYSSVLMSLGVEQ